MLKESKDDDKQKISALQKVMTTLDIMSTGKEAAFTILRGQLADTIHVFLQKDLNWIGNQLEQVSDAHKDIEKGDNKIQILEYALIILNRCLVQQIHAIVTDTQEALFLYQLPDEEGITPAIEFGVNDAIQLCIWDEFKIQVEEAVKCKTDCKNMRYMTFALLTQAMTNILILSSDQDEFIRRILKSKTLNHLLTLLTHTTSDLLQFKKGSPAQRNFRYFVQFVIHSFRFVIVCQSIDPKCLS